jgi:hypothetical protein
VGGIFFDCICCLPNIEPRAKNISSVPEENEKKCNGLVCVHVSKAVPEIPANIQHIYMIQCLHNEFLGLGKGAISTLSEV